MRLADKVTSRAAQMSGFHYIVGSDVGFESADQYRLLCGLDDLDLARRATTMLAAPASSTAGTGLRNRGGRRRV